uniref:Cytochrome P450 n=1 Tax=Panagrolaimus davidi TaxID=227884 RepID=A0A914PS85_9BILA
MIDPLSPNPYHSPNIHIFGARGQRWKRQRTIVSSTLNTFQLRKMLPLIHEQIDDFIIYLSNYLLKQNLIYFSPNEFDIHSLFQQLTAAVIGRCALGLRKNSFKNPPKHFEFFKQIFGAEPSVAMDYETFQCMVSKGFKSSKLGKFYRDNTINHKT